jgi:signal transduction histidine kinase
LLVLARGETERPLEMSVVALRDVLGRLVLEYPGVALAATGRGDVVGDADRLVQVFRNLVRNGVQAAGRPEGVRVELVETGDVHVVSVSDDGPGLTAELRERIFERGFRRGAGTGVGLAIAKDLVERHGGTVRAVAGSAPGAMLEVRLPALAARLDATGLEAPR